MKTFEYLISFSNLDWEIKISENKGKNSPKIFLILFSEKGTAVEQYPKYVC